MTVDFIAGKAKAHSAILDLGCGTGNHALALAALGHRITGIDLDEQMIRLAREKAGDLECSFKVGDMRHLKELNRRDSYDLVYSLGNSLAHLPEREDAAMLIAECHSVLKPGGVLIVQIVNFDRVIKKRIRELPEIVNDKAGVTFFRKYEYPPGDPKRINFVSELVIHRAAGEERIVSAVPLLPLKSAELKSIFTAAFFKEIAFFGDFSGSAFVADSPATIICGLSRRSPQSCEASADCSPRARRAAG